MYNNYYYALDPARGDSPSLDLVVGVPVAAVVVILIITAVVFIILCVLIKNGNYKFNIILANVKSS